MKTGWNVSDYVKYIKVQLGGSVLQLSSESDLTYVVEKIAFEDLKNYINDIYTMEAAYAPILDLSGKKVADVKYVLRDKNNSASITGMDTNLFIYQTQGQYGINQWARDQITYNLLINRVKNSMTTDMDFHYDYVKEHLYLYSQSPIPTSVTIGYIPDFQDVSEIVSPYWISFLKRLSVAYAKQVEGRIRSKYTVSSSAYTLDGDKLLAESEAELSKIMDELNSNVNITHIIS